MQPPQSTGSYLLLPKGAAASWDQARPSLNAAVNLAIGKDFDRFVELSKISAFFDKICPRH
jgi:hypothetical protein